MDYAHRFEGLEKTICLSVYSRKTIAAKQRKNEEP
jgi:hypothetical protein